MPEPVKSRQCIRCKVELTPRNSVGAVHCITCYHAMNARPSKPATSQSIEATVADALNPFKPGSW